MCMFTVYVGEHVLLGLSERATFEHNPEHGLVVGLLVNEAKRVGVRPPTSCGNGARCERPRDSGFFW